MPRLPYGLEATYFSAPQNAKQEIFWATIEGRLLAMLEGVEELTLALLNEATLAFVELEYNRKPHSELGCSPLEKFLNHKSVLRECPSSDELRRSTVLSQKSNPYPASQ